MTRRYVLKTNVGVGIISRSPRFDVSRFVRDAVTPKPSIFALNNPQLELVKCTIGLIGARRRWDDGRGNGRAVSFERIRLVSSDCSGLR